MSHPAFHETRLRVRYAETDQMGVVYHSNHLIWFEVGRVELMRQMGFSYRDLEQDEGRYIAVAEVKCRYRAPVYYDEEVIVRTRLKSVRSSVVVFSYELVRVQGETLLADGETTHIVTDSSMKVAPLPEKYLKAFRAAISNGRESFLVIPNPAQRKGYLNALHINGNDLTLQDVREVAAEHRAVLLAPDAREAVDLARAVVDEIVAGNKVAYAITTGVGKLSDVRIAGDQIRELQVNLVRSHAVGVGEPLSIAETRAIMLLRANSLSKGHSGVRAVVIDKLCEMLNRGVTPMVPSQGSVGASGDLAPLAHLAIALIGEGECIDEKSQRIPSSDALKRAQITPLVLESKETISLINGTQAMLAVGTLSLLAAETLVDTADVLGGLCCDALKGTDTAFDERIHHARPHAGQTKTAANLRRMLEGSQIRESHRACGRVQDAYSLRCIPQVHGAVRDTLAHCRQVFETEANSAVDNPLVFITDAKNAEGDVISGGNFHGEPLAFALDFLAIALSALAGISERRIERLVNPALSEGLPPFLAPGAGLNSGFMMPQVTAAALVSENKVLAHPASVDSITTSGNKEDYVSMGMTAAIKLKRIVENTRNVLAIEAMAVAQALDFLLPLKTSKRGQAAQAAIRSVCPTMEKDRVMYKDLARISDLIGSGNVAEALR